MAYLVGANANNSKLPSVVGSGVKVAENISTGLVVTSGLAYVIARLFKRLYPTDAQTLLLASTIEDVPALLEMRRKSRAT